MNNKKPFIIWFKDLGIKDIPLAGGKNASLGEMYSKLTKQGVRIPNGFAITSYAYYYFLEQAGIKEQIKIILRTVKIKDIENLYYRGNKVRELILNSDLPPDLEKEIIKAYKKLSKFYNGGKNGIDIAVRSSATAEDLPDASFAGQQETFLNVRGEKELLLSCKKCFASLFTNRAIVYREEKKFDHLKIGLSIGIQKMVRSDLASSGVMFSLDTESGFRNVVLINSIYGLGENIVQGRVTPDEFYVFKPTLEKGYQAILSKKIGNKSEKMIYTENPKIPTKNIKVSKTASKKFSISDTEILTLADWAIKVEKHYNEPIDIEWAKDGQNNKLYIVQARPETVQSQKNLNVLEEFKLLQKSNLILTGAAVGSKIGVGKVNIIEDVNNIKNFKKGDILVTEMTDPDWMPIMKKASAIVTNKGGRTCHAAIVSRELGTPCIVGTENGTKILKQKQAITVSCAEGEKGYIYDKILKFKIVRHNLKNIKRPKTKVMMNIGNPETAFAKSFIPNDGVGLAREEFIINSYIKIHPLALINFEKLKNEKRLTKKEITEIEKLTNGYTDKKQFFINKLTEGIAIIAGAFYPKNVIVRFSDFKSNEYINLIGGHIFEPIENNPMIGWRGASRYYSKEYRSAFDLECAAIAKVRRIIGLNNVKVMIPFCRTIEEGKKVINIMKKNGLKQGKNGLKIYMMCEIPSNVILLEEFAKLFDGFSIGSNDLTQLTLGVDRDSELISHIYDERNLAVKTLVKLAIEKAKKLHKKIGICGQAPSDFPDFAKFLVKCGIDSISLNPDTVIKTTIEISKQEKNKL
ncbi:MAG: phosphoenolpyruvate synthase [Xanthomonadaceae bacterium]|nr:phosphoenolpyruvate synthase [Rhodospirillaceae bacterium]NIA18164.1 phosphoenolpyruvate synthase [Xanthomonadaceae bacterium]